MVKQYEFIQKATVKFLRFNDVLLQCTTLLMFRVHNLVEVVKYEPTSHDQLLSIGHKTSGNLYPPSNTTPLTLHGCYCSDHDFFTRVVYNAISVVGLFHPKNKKPLHDIVTKSFHNRFNCNNKPSTTIVVVIEVLRKFVCIGDGDRGDMGEPAFKLPEELGDSSLDIVRAEEDYSETELQDILGSICRIKTFHGFELSNNAPTEIDRLSQIQAPIRRLIFNGTEDEEDGCSICLEEFHQGQEIAKLHCSHTFHKNCALKWLPHNGSCPMCRSACKTPII